MYVAGFDRGVRPIGDWSMSMTLSRWSTPVDPVVQAGLGDGAVEVAGERLAEDVADERAFARPAHPRDADEEAERDRDVDRS